MWEKALFTGPAGIRKTSGVAVDVPKTGWLASKPGQVDSPGTSLEDVPFTGQLVPGMVCTRDR